MKENLISVIIPIYKVEQFLDECIESIIHQTYNNLEIILVDDGSPDGCPKMCDEWARKDSRIRAVHKKNGGLSSARNAGLDVATGDYISFVDSDDFIAQDALFNLHHRFQDSEKIGIVSGMIYRYQDGKTCNFKDSWTLKDERIISSEKFLLETMSQKTSYTVWNKLYKRELLDGVRFREGRNNEDTLFMYDLGKRMHNLNILMVEIPKFVYYYRYREDSICTTSKLPLAIDILGNLELMMQDCKQSDGVLYTILYRQYAKNLFNFVDSLLLNPVWEPLYFEEYQAKLRKVPFSFIRKTFAKNDVLYIQLLKWMPLLRKMIRVITEHRSIKS